MLAIQMAQQTITIKLQLVQPLVAGGRYLNERSELRRNKIRHRDFTRAREVLICLGVMGLQDCTRFGTSFAAVRWTGGRMYAIKSSNEIYHLLQRGGYNTLCGLRVSRVTAVRPHLANKLDTTIEKVCKHCRRINEQDSAK